MRALVKRLVKLKNQFSPADRAAKLGLLTSLGGMEILDPGVLLAYHEALLFLRAYPDDATIFKMACRECARFVDRVRLLGRKNAAAAAKLADTGIVGTAFYYRYDYAVVIWLVRWYGDALEIDWDELESTERIEQLLPVVSTWMENDGLDLADIGTREWIELGKGKRSSLRWLLESMKRAIPSFTQRMSIYDALELPIVWQLGDAPAARTHAGAPSRTPYYHHDGLRKTIGDFRAGIAAPIADIRHAEPRAARALIKAIRTTLAVRHRALYPVDYANQEEVIVAAVGRGYEIILFGMEPERRLPIESDYGVLLLKNGFIFGYGVGAMLFDQVEIAVNIFDTWRGGESRYVFTQFVRVFHHHFRSQRFKIERYQIGYENEEGITSGAFWFYYRLGFIPKEPRVRALAAREAAKITRNPAYRTPPATLERLAESDLYMALDPASEAIAEDFPLADLSLRVTAMIGREFDGDRARALAGCAEQVVAALDNADWQQWPAAERQSFSRLALVMALVPDLAALPVGEKSALCALMRAKGQPREAEYARRMATETRFRLLLEHAVRR